MRKTAIQSNNEYSLLRGYEPMSKTTALPKQHQQQIIKTKNIKITGNSGYNSPKNGIFNRQQGNAVKEDINQEYKVNNKNEREDQQTKASKNSSDITIQLNNKLNNTIQFQNEIQRLISQIQAKNNQIKAITKSNEKRKIQIIEFQKNKSYNQGKIKYMSQQLTKYQTIFVKIGKECDQKSQALEISLLCGQMRKQLEQITGKYQQKCYQLNKLTEKYIKIKSKLSIKGSSNSKNKYDNEMRQLSSLKRNGSQSVIIGHTSQNIKQMNVKNQDNQNQQIKMLLNRIEGIHAKITEFNNQNIKLNNQLCEKDAIIFQINKQLYHYKQKQRKTRQRTSSDKKSTCLQNIKKIHPGEQYNLNIINRQNINNGDTSTNQIPTIAYKLKYNLLTQQISHTQLLQFLLQKNKQKEDALTQYPYYLTYQQAYKLIKYMSSYNQRQMVPVLQKIIPKYKNISLRQQYLAKIRIYNVYTNRQSEFRQFINQNRSKYATQYINLEQFEQYLRKNWGLTTQQIDVLIKIYYDYTGPFLTIEYKKILQIINKWSTL